MTDLIQAFYDRFQDCIYFIDDGKVAECSDALTSFAMIGDVVALMALINHVGTGSRVHTIYTAYYDVVRVVL